MQLWIAAFCIAAALDSFPFFWIVALGFSYTAGSPVTFSEILGRV